MKLPSHSFTDSEISLLKHYRDKQKVANLRIRFIAIIMISQGYNVETIAKVIGRTKKAIQNWFVIYLSKDGIDKLNKYNYVGRKTFLKKQEISEVIKWVKTNNPGTIKEVEAKIYDDYKIRYTNEGVRKLLKNNGLKLLLPKVIPGNPPSAEEQQVVVDQYHEMKANCEPGTVFLFGDGMHLVHQNIPAACWGDPKERPILQTNTGRKRLNILGAYNPDTHSLVHLTGEENCNALTVIEFFTLILNSYRNAPKVIIILDNAKYFKAKIVNEWLAKNPKLEIVFLPAYCPNLNLIERLWRFVKDKLVKNIYHKKYITFRAKAFQLLNSISEHKDKLRTLMVEKFEIVHYAQNTKK